MFMGCVSSDRGGVKMKYIEIDGEKVEVHDCKDCPCYDQGSEYRGCAMCRHPSRSHVESYEWVGGLNRTEYVRVSKDRWIRSRCPLREVEE